MLIASKQQLTLEFWGFWGFKNTVSHFFRAEESQGNVPPTWKKKRWKTFSGALSTDTWTHGTEDGRWIQSPWHISLEQMLHTWTGKSVCVVLHWVCSHSSLLGAITWSTTSIEWATPCQVPVSRPPSGWGNSRGWLWEGVQGSHFFPEILQLQSKDESKNFGTFSRTKLVWNLKLTELKAAAVKEFFFILEMWWWGPGRSRVLLEDLPTK